MTRREWFLLLVWIVVVFVLVFVPAMPFVWILFRGAAWYVGKAPEHQLPLTQYVSPSHKRFCEWLSGLLSDLGGLTPSLVSLISLGAIFAAKDMWELDLLMGWWITGVVLILLYLFLFPFLRYSHWDYYLAQAGPAAQLLVGGKEEYDKLSEVDRKKLIRHVADVLIGINKGTWVVGGGKAQLYNAPTGWLAKFGGPGVLVVQEGHAVVLERSGRISRVVGYGLHFLQPFERVNTVVYLAVNSEHMPIKHVITKDKVVIDEIDVYVFHKVDPGDKSRKNGMYPFDVKIILEKVWTPRVSEREGKAADLGGSVRAVADTAVRDVIAQYNLADLITATGDIRQKLKGEFKSAIERVTDVAMGIKIVVVDVGYIKFPADVQQELVEVAKAKAKKEKVLTDAEAEKSKTITLAEGEYRAIIAKAEAEKLANIAKGEGRREFLMKEGEGKAYAARETKFAEAEGQAERVRQYAEAIVSRGGDKAALELLATLLRSEDFRNLMPYLLGRSRGVWDAEQSEGRGNVESSKSTEA